MGLEYQVLKRVLERKPKKILCLGYPDLLVVDKDLDVLGVPQNARHYAQDMGQIAGWHHWRGPIYDTDVMFRSLNIEPTYVDIHPSREYEEKLDLNLPLPRKYAHQFDMVLDSGTLEHCFNIAQAFMNCLDACSTGGTIIHSNPASMTNHGFWDISLGAYRDFYENWNEKIVEACYIGGEVDSRQVIPIAVEDMHKRFSLQTGLMNLVVVSVGRNGFPNNPWPTQFKYRMNKDLKNDSLRPSR